MSWMTGSMVSSRKKGGIQNRVKGTHECCEKDRNGGYTRNVITDQTGDSKQVIGGG